MRGDKTMLDALGPFVESFEAAVERRNRLAYRVVGFGRGGAEVRRRNRRAAPEGRPGSPARRAQRRHPDAGAVSLAMCTHVVAEQIEERRR